MQPLVHWEGMFVAGVGAHIIVSRCAAPIMRSQDAGLMLNTTFWDLGNYLGNLFYDVSKAGINRMAHRMAQELAEHDIAVVA